MQRKYESMIVISPVISLDAAKAINNEVIELVKKQEGEMVKTDEWGKKTLAYEIKKNREGYYFINYFTLDPEKISEIDRYYRINENIIRHNLLTK